MVTIIIMVKNLIMRIIITNDKIILEITKSMKIAHIQGMKTNKRIVKNLMKIQEIKNKVIIKMKVLDHRITLDPVIKGGPKVMTPVKKEEIIKSQIFNKERM